MKSDWKYNPDELLDLDTQSPENLIDWLKMEHIRKYLPKGRNVLEVGAGSGRLLTRIGMEGNYRVVGIDYVKDSVRQIKGNIVKFGLNGDVILADARYLPIKDGIFSVVSSGGLLEHFDVDGARILIKEMVRVLREDGLFYADIAPKKSSLLRPVILKDAGGFENNFSADLWIMLFRQCGLKNVELFPGLILPPNFYEWFQKGIVLKMMYKYRNFIHGLDNTIWAAMLGFEYLVFAKKGNDYEEK
ncbi:MAG: class I SAM-dependent methyltransferase [Pedobacter sp.]|uniref:class I SAM-dependent methyltransferase n=1 Tax=Pedobacter sp. TaxID=1411316 RepID=UPI003563290F